MTRSESNKSKKPRYTFLTLGKYWNFKPTPKMKAAGFSNESLGTNQAKAWQRAEYLVSEWNRLKKQPQIIEIQAGSVSDLVDRFKLDPTWYKQKAPATREAMDAVFKYVNTNHGDVKVNAIERKHCRKFYNDLRIQGSISKAEKYMKWFRRLLQYAVEIGFIEYNPSDKMQIESPPPRRQLWTPADLFKVIDAAETGGKDRFNNTIPARPSLGLAIRIAYDTSLPPQDILDLRWSQFDDGVLNVLQKKKRGNIERPHPLHPDTIAILESIRAGNVVSINGNDDRHILISESTGNPYDNRRVFAKLFRKFRDRAGVNPDLKFGWDIRRTTLTELGAKGATRAEIVALSGHKLNSNVLDIYVIPTRETADNAQAKRWGKF